LGEVSNLLDYNGHPNVGWCERHMMTEESVVSKVEGLMETLDHVKRYNALARSLKKFAVVIASSFVIFLVLRGLVDFFDLSSMLDRPVFFSVLFLLILIPVVGIAAGVLIVRKSVNSVRTGEWKEELSHGFPSALKILQELDWDKTLDEISVGRLSYFLYGLLKTTAYWFVTFLALGLIGATFAFFFPLRSPFFGGFFLGLIALLIVFLILRNDLLRRYKEILSLDMLLWELRWFSLEFRRAEFQT
jgi:F0F1-type ATP synthase assembly protein I